MKFSTSFLQLVSLATSAVAAPLVTSPLNLFKIQVISDNPLISNKFLSLINGAVNIQRGGYTPLQVILNNSEIGNQVNLHLANDPASATPARVDEVLALQGEPGVQRLVQTYVTGTTEPADIDAYSFFIEASMIKDDLKGGKWLAFPPVGKTDGWTVSWYDGKVPIIQDFYPVQLRVAQVGWE